MQLSSPHPQPAPSACAKVFSGSSSLLCSSLALGEGRQPRGISSRPASGVGSPPFALGLELIISGLLDLVAMADSPFIVPSGTVDGTWAEGTWQGAAAALTVGGALCRPGRSELWSWPRPTLWVTSARSPGLPKCQVSHLPEPLTWGFTPDMQTTSGKLPLRASFVGQKNWVSVGVSRER